MSLSLGFEPRQLLTARIDLPSPAYRRRQAIIRFSTRIGRKLNNFPEVEKFALAANPPLMTGWQTGFHAGGNARTAAGSVARQRK